MLAGDADALDGVDADDAAERFILYLPELFIFWCIEIPDIGLVALEAWLNLLNQNSGKLF